MWLIPALAAAVVAATPVQPAPAFNPRETFAPLALPEAVNRYRSANGAPGPDYWQNRADYQIHARLDAAAKTLSGEVVIGYLNNSPDSLDCLWLQLDQNIYRRDARSVTASRFPRSAFSDGFVIDAVTLSDGRRTAPASWRVSDTRMRVELPTPLRTGGRRELRIRYHYAVPGLWGGRTAWAATPKGDIFDIAQWYPRMAVYDDIRGWDTAPYLGQEFYLEYGDFDYFITVPADMLVAGTGELINPEEVLTAAQRARLAQARGSDKTVLIRPAAEIDDPASRPRGKPELTWHFRMRDTRDVAFSASRAFVWDAARIRLADGKTALAQSFYPAESAGEGAWSRSTEYLKDAVEHFSARWGAFPWPNAYNIAGPVAAMEYPGMGFNAITDKGQWLFAITAHEIGHSWFPMMVGFDERRDAWMDEGFNTFIDTLESDDFAGAAYGPKRDSEYAPGGGNPVDEIGPVLADPDAPPIFTRADLIGEKYRHSVTYFKTALGLVLLREQILGPDRFDPAFRKFIADWAFKHPKPSDFFRSMDSEGGEDLSWFWRGWFFENWDLDLAVKGVGYVDGDPAKGARVTIANLDKLVMPASLEIRYADGHVADIAVPAETWMLGGEAVITTPPGGPIAAVSLDPRHQLPDRDRRNNTASVAVP